MYRKIHSTHRDQYSAFSGILCGSWHISVADKRNYYILTVMGKHLKARNDMI